MEEFIEKYGGNERNLQVYLFLFEEMSRSLTLMHSTRTCHKDIRPANFYLQGQLMDLRNIVPKLGFFGTDKEPIGMTYLAPEVKDPEKMNEPADTWALGVIFYQMLAGCLPFDDIARTGPPNPLPKYVPMDICDLVYSMICKDSSYRPEMQHVNSRLMPLLVQVMQSPTLLKLEELKFTLSSKHPVIEEKKRGLGTFQYGVCAPFEMGQVQFKRISYPGGYTYEGEVKAGTEVWHGRGVYVRASGGEEQMHEGWFKDGNRHGRGRSIWQDGSVYEGELKQGRKDGFGTFHFGASGRSYVGSWVMDKREGHGVFHFETGSR